MIDEKYCPSCRHRNNCPWLDISNDSCEGKFYKKDGRRNVKEEIRDSAFQRRNKK